MNTSPVPMFGVETVKRSTRCAPGCTPPSITEQAVALKSSSRTIQWFCSVFDSTIKLGGPLRSGGRSPAMAGKAKAQIASSAFLMMDPPRGVQTGRLPTPGNGAVSTTRLDEPGQHLCDRGHARGRVRHERCRAQDHRAGQLFDEAAVRGHRGLGPGRDPGEREG